MLTSSTGPFAPIPLRMESRRTWNCSTSSPKRTKHQFIKDSSIKLSTEELLYQILHIHKTNKGYFHLLWHSWLRMKWRFWSRQVRQPSFHQRWQSSHKTQEELHTKNKEFWEMFRWVLSKSILGVNLASKWTQFLINHLMD